MVRGLAVPFTVFQGVVGAKWEQTPLLTPIVDLLTKS
jgi:hypothetical protein